MLSRRLLLLLPLALAPTLFGQEPTVARPDTLKAVPVAMQKFVDSEDLSGAVTVVGRADGVVAFDAVGLRDRNEKTPMTKDTLFRIASMTKPVTALGIMILADEGKLSPDDDVAKHLPEFTGQMLLAPRPKDAPADAPVVLQKPTRPVKLRDLLTHTSGAAPYPKGVNDVYTKRNRTLAETALATALQPLRFEPGSQWSYSNEGIDVLGRVIEVASGESYEAFLQKRVFGPLEMKDTTFYPSRDQRDRVATTYFKGRAGQLFPSPNVLLAVPEGAKHPVPAGGLFSTGADLAKLYRMMLHKGDGGGKRVVSEKAVAEMTKVQTGDLKTGFVDGMGFGFGWAVVREPKGVTAMLSPGTFGHGGAFGTQGWIDPTRDLFVVLLIQRTGLDNADASPMREKLQSLAVQAVK
ncbi:serine hydrolase domain-containing protein [Frigoriglobus tundricola]|uniref:Beta-lactamase class C-like and penicillin binding proteins (PBPs) superfamily n=1 Tax=Frigoriglobus tundricola TaxID=2774151 RepID=A0A6M5YVV1_9BACT|nr:serine hydrolase domain-containing protein [Frigoriglobus tundricola]QJW97516.1 Beta-lactamase class C-like and penicillin binding proteins (PBPs) superfamily [Frigoriglobus tundricola]